jgi:serine/threonine protein kinase
VYSEAEKLASMRHPCVVAFYGIVVQPGSYATVLEYVRNGSLRSGLGRIKKQVGLPT